jgi:hypothetical protein
MFLTGLLQKSTIKCWKKLNLSPRDAYAWGTTQKLCVLPFLRPRTQRAYGILEWTGREDLTLPSLRYRTMREIEFSTIRNTLEHYKANRSHYAKMRQKIKKTRLIPIGPFASVTFECYDLIWFQIHEMILVERGGERQIPDELIAYNPLIPDYNSIVITLMFEIDDAERRKKELFKLGHVEDTIFLLFGQHKIKGIPIEDESERTTPEGKTSAVHFLKFPLTEQQGDEFRNLTEEKKVVLAIEHPSYPHSTTLSKKLVEDIICEMNRLQNLQRRTESRE